MDVLSPLKKASQEILDILFPIACVGCGTYGEGNRDQDTESRDDAERWLCTACREQIEPDRARCVVCKEPSRTGRTCYPCLPRTSLAGTSAVGPYANTTLRTAITALKFRGVRALAHPLGELLARRIAALGVADAVLIPLPLHAHRERERGFNQARLLADVAGARLGMPVHDILIRTRSTASQTSVWGGARTRRANVADAFAMRTPVAGFRPPETGNQESGSGNQRVILIDDVLTSGATLDAAARVLVSAGAKEIWAAVIARG